MENNASAIVVAFITGGFLVLTTWLAHHLRATARGSPSASAGPNWSSSSDGTDPTDPREKPPTPIELRLAFQEAQNKVCVSEWHSSLQGLFTSLILGGALGMALVERSFTTDAILLVGLGGLILSSYFAPGQDPSRSLRNAVNLLENFLDRLPAPTDRMRNRKEDVSLPADHDRFRR